MTRDEDNRHLGALGANALLQFQAVETRKGDIENEAARNHGFEADAEIPSRTEKSQPASLRFGSMTKQRLAHLRRRHQ